MTNKKLDELIERIDLMHEWLAIQSYNPIGEYVLLQDCKAALIEAKEANENT